MATTISYRTPMGCFGTWEEAAVAVERADMDPCACIQTLASPVDVSYEVAYGSAMKLSRSIRCY